MKCCKGVVLCLAMLAAPLIGGCGLTVVPGVGGFVTISVINNTDFDVDPGVEFGAFSTSLAFLDVGVLAPGDIVDVDVDCDDIVFLTTTDSAQLGGSVDYVLDPLPIFELDLDYFCGEIVEFEFVGNGQDFDVFVDAGGENIF